MDIPDGVHQAAAFLLCRGPAGSGRRSSDGSDAVSAVSRSALLSLGCLCLGAFLILGLGCLGEAGGLVLCGAGNREG